MSLNYLNTLLMSAIENNPAPDVIERLVQLGADLNAKDRHGATPLSAAINRRVDPSIVELLVKLGATVHALDTALRLGTEKNVGDDEKEDIAITGLGFEEDEKSDDPWGDRYSGPGGEEKLMNDIGFDDPDDYASWLDSR